MSRDCTDLTLWSRKPKIFFFKILVIYLRKRERKRTEGRGREEDSLLTREPDTGLNLRNLRFLIPNS